MNSPVGFSANPAEQHPPEMDYPPSPLTAAPPQVERGFFTFLLAVFGYLAYFSGRKLLWFDELLSYFTERAPSASAVLRIQAATPVSLDPPLYHLLGHWILKLGLNEAFSIRFPSLLGCIAMVAGVYLYTKRIAGFYAAAISVVGLILTYDFYLTEARPYGILLGATGLSLLFWQNSIRDINRRFSLIGLFLVLGLAISCHYFAILIPVSLLLAELFRTIRRRRLDMALGAAILSSYACILFWLPFLKAAGEYKAHYYVSAEFMSCIRSYSWLDEIHRSFKGLSAATDTVLFLAIVASVVAGAYLSFKAAHKTQTSRRSAHAALDVVPEEWLALVFLALTPVFGGILALAGAGSYLARYVLEASIGLMVPRISGILTFVRSPRIKLSILALCSVLVIVAFVRDARHDQKERALLQFSESQATPGTLVIPDQYDNYLRLHYYASPQVIGTSQFPFVADMQSELRWKDTDNLSRTMLNMKQFTSLPVMSYNELLHSHRPIVLIVDKSDRHTWIAEQLKKDQVQFTLKATLGNLSVYSLQLPAVAQR